MKHSSIILSLLALLGIFIYEPIYSQKQGQDKIDSLLALLSETKSDSIKLVALYEISYTYRFISYEKGIKYGQDLLVFSVKLKDKIAEGKAYTALGVNYSIKPDFPKSLSYSLKAIDIFSTYNDERNKGIPYNNIGNVYLKLGDSKKAFEYYYKALKIFDTFDMKLQQAIALGNIGLVYQSTSNFDKSLEYGLKALKIFESVNDSNGIARMLLNTANIYEVKKNYSKSLPNKFQALNIYENLKDLMNIAQACDNLSYTYMILALNKDNFELPDSLKNKSYCIQKAEYFIKRAIKLNEETRNVFYLKDNYDGLSNIYFEKKDYKNALEYFRKSVVLRDSIFSHENLKQLKEVELKKTEELNQKKEEIRNLQIKSIQKEKIFLIIGLLSLLVFSFLIYKNLITQKHTNKLLAIEKKKSDELLLNILPSEVAEELKEKGHADAKQFELVSVMFTDFKNFTKISEKLSPTELVSEIHFCFEAFDNIITRHQIEKIKTIGDAYMCVGGLPTPNLTNPLDITLAAMEIQAFMSERNAERIKLGKDPFEIRIGIHTGNVVAGIVGVKKFAYDIWGDTVNIASRMESSGEAGKINISGSTYELIKDKFTCTYRGKIEAKGKGELDMYFVDGAKNKS